MSRIKSEYRDFPKNFSTCFLWNREPLKVVNDITKFIQNYQGVPQTQFDPFKGS